MTIFADASRTAKGTGWGGWHIQEGAAHFIGGPLPDGPSIDRLELMALTLCVEHATQTHSRPHVVVLQSDSLSALQAVHVLLPWTKTARGSDRRIPRRRIRPPCPIETRAGERMSAALGDLPVFLKHIKGHQGGRRSRSRVWVNHACDAIARAAADGMLLSGDLHAAKVVSKLRRGEDPWRRDQERIRSR